MKWNQKYTNTLESLGSKPLKTEQCIFKNEDSAVFLAIHVDDGILVENSKSELQSVIKNLEKHFRIRSSNANSFIGFELIFKDGVYLSHSNYIDEVLKQYKI